MVDYTSNPVVAEVDQLVAGRYLRRLCGNIWPKQLADMAKHAPQPAQTIVSATTAGLCCIK
jgi:hypothetical protein